MTILGKMAASLSAKHQIDQCTTATGTTAATATTEHHSSSDNNSTFDEFAKSRSRSGRTGSLALPNNSLLDLYDQQQVQCSSATLLPTANSNNSVIRRHSSHCCPMLNERQTAAQTTTTTTSNLLPHKQQQLSSLNGQLLTNNDYQSIQNGKCTTNMVNDIIIVPPLPPPIPKRTFNNKSSFINNHGGTGNLTNEDQHFQQQQHTGTVARDRNHTNRLTSRNEQQHSQYYNNIMEKQHHYHHQHHHVPKYNSRSSGTTKNYANSHTETSIVTKPLSSLFYHNNSDNNHPSSSSSSSMYNNRIIVNNCNGSNGSNGSSNIQTRNHHQMSKRQYELSKNRHYNSIVDERNHSCSSSASIINCRNSEDDDEEEEEELDEEDDDDDLDAEVDIDIDVDEEEEEDDDDNLRHHGIIDEDALSLENSVFEEPRTILMNNSNNMTANNASSAAAASACTILNVLNSNSTTKTTSATAATVTTVSVVATTNTPPPTLSNSTLNNSTIINLSSNNPRYSNRLSSDSNKSQITIDTGYISSNGSEKNLTSVESRTDFRSRFSSVDTQSSLDSCLTEKTIDSPLSKESFRIDSGRSSSAAIVATTSTGGILTNNIDYNNTIENSIIYHNNMKNGHGGRNLPIVPIRKQYSGTSTTIHTKSINDSTNHNHNSYNNNSNNKNRPTPPTPPMRSQQSIESINFQILNNCNPNVLIGLNNGTGRKLPNIGKNGCETTSTTPATTTNNNNNNNGTTTQQQQPISFRKKFLTKNRPSPIVYQQQQEHKQKQHPKLHQRQDSSISSDSYSMTSSPGYNSKSMEVPLIQHSHSQQRHHQIMPNNNNNTTTSCINIEHGSNLSIVDSYNLCLQQQQQQQPIEKSLTNVTTTNCGRRNLRQNSIISNESFGQASSPSYNMKNMQAPLLPSMKKYIQTKTNFKISNDIIHEHQDQQPQPQPQLQEPTTPNSPITKSASIPASLQTVVRFQNGQSNMSLHHNKIVNRRKSSAVAAAAYVADNRLKFRFLQIFINALALLIIAGGLVAYFNAYPTIKFINKTIITPMRIEETTEIFADKNPAPGICLPIIVKFCQSPNVPYNYTVFPNYIGHFGQLETQVDLESYDALVDVRCYELVSLFLCTLFVPKCGPTGTTVPPCKSLCTETMRRCGFFFDVFGLGLPDYLNCNLFTDHMNPDECVGNQQVINTREEAFNPTCTGFLCDQTRCIPNDWRCDGHVDCLDQRDESNCEFCDENSIYCGEKHCMNQKHMCDGIVDCPFGQDERSCIRLSERNGDIGKGFLEIYKIQDNRTHWVPACITNWDNTVSPPAICSMLGYNSVTQHQLSKSGNTNTTTTSGGNTGSSTTTFLSATRYSADMSRKYQKDKTNFIKEFSKCPTKGNYPVVELTCNNFECGKIRNKKHKQSKRIVGGHASNPGDWPFLAAILGGPEEIFYCAGVLIADQWVLTASHCIGNHTLRDINDWTIQLGVTRRNAHSYYGKTVKVIHVIPHPHYNTEIAHDNDIALFQLAERVAFHEHLLPVCLPPPNLIELKAGTSCTVIGWGKREERNPNTRQEGKTMTTSYELSVNEVKVPVVKREICDEWLESLNVTEGMICAGYADGGKDACQGDSGGPLLCPYPGERDKWFVGGIVSWGIMCAHPKLPGVYANVPKYIPWIKNEINKYSNQDNNNNINQDNNINLNINKKIISNVKTDDDYN